MASAAGNFRDALASLRRGGHSVRGRSKMHCAALQPPQAPRQARQTGGAGLCAVTRGLTGAAARSCRPTSLLGTFGHSKGLPPAGAAASAKGMLSEAGIGANVMPVAR